MRDDAPEGDPAAGAGFGAGHVGFAREDPEPSREDDTGNPGHAERHRPAPALRDGSAQHHAQD